MGEKLVKLMCSVAAHYPFHGSPCPIFPHPHSPRLGEGGSLEAQRSCLKSKCWSGFLQRDCTHTMTVALTGKRIHKRMLTRGASSKILRLS